MSSLTPLIMAIPFNRRNVAGAFLAVAFGSWVLGLGSPMLPSMPTEDEASELARTPPINTFVTVAASGIGFALMASDLPFWRRP